LEALPPNRFDSGWLRLMETLIKAMNTLPTGNR
jgi:hypothetical protein